MSAVVLEHVPIKTTSLTPRQQRSPFVSVVIPVYNEELVLGVLHERLKDVMQSEAVAYEVIFVNDGSTDQTMGRLTRLADAYTHVKIIDLSRNFGHQIAVSAGIDHAIGEVVVLIDADLQDPPELITKFLDRWKAGYDVVYAVREQRMGESWFKRWTAERFYRFINRRSEVPIPLDTGDFSLMDRSVVDALISMPERHRFVRGLVSWVGFNQVGVPYVREQRFAGESKYPLRKMIQFATEGITSLSHRPLKWATKLGCYSGLLGFLAAAGILYEKLFTHNTIQGWTSLIVVALFLGSIQLLVLGVIGEYIGRVYDEVRHRPLYFVKEKRNFVEVK